MPASQNFVRGAMLLAGAAMVSKLLGSVYTIVLQNVIGDAGMGLFQMAYPIYATLLAIATAGFPVAISKLVSERLALDDLDGAKRVFRLASLLLILFGISCFFVLFLWAPVWAHLAGDGHAVWAIRAIAPALLIVPFMSAVRGYFQGYQWMQPTAVSQIAEQGVRVLTILAAAVWLTSVGYGPRVTAAGAAFGAVTGALAGLLILIYYWRRRHLVEARRTKQNVSSKGLVKQLLYYAFPISLGALVVPLMNNVDVVTVVNLLKSTGMSQTLATTNFGLLTGRAFKLMMLPTTLAAGIGIAVMPAVSEAFTMGFRRLMSDRIDLSIRLTALLALPASVGLALLARPINVALFENGLGTSAVRILAYATVFASLQTTTAAVLQGAGWMYLPVLNLALAGVVKLVGNLMLVPKYGIVGASVATVISYAVASALNFYAMKRRLGERLRFGHWLFRPVMATVIMGGVVFAMVSQWDRWGGLEAGRISTALFAVVACTVGILVYLVALVASGAVDEDELTHVPHVGPALAKWFQRLGMLR